MNNGFHLLEKKWELGPHQAHPPLSHSWLRSLGTTQLTQVPSGPSLTSLLEPVGVHVGLRLAPTSVGGNKRP